MKWRNHKIVTFCAVYSITGGFIAALSSMIGSVLPDVMELGGIIKHRTVTHYLWFWTSACLFGWALLKTPGYSASLICYVAFFVVCGGFLHVCQDALSLGGIPIFTPFGTKVGLGVYRTDTFGEELTTLGLVAVFVFFAWKRGFLSFSYIEGQIGAISQLF